MSDTSADFGIPYMQASQGQPEITHNEALLLLQALLNGALTLGDNTPPGSPSEGDIYILGTSPTGAWAGRANCVAVYDGSGWKFVPGQDDAGTPITMGARHVGMRMWLRSTGAEYVWTDSGASPADYAWRQYNVPSAPTSYFGQLTVSGNTTGIALTAASDSTLYTNGDYTQITGIWDAIPHGVNNGVTQQTNSFTVLNDGDYRIEMWGAVTASNSNVNIAVKFAVDGTIGLTRRPRAKIGSSGDIANISAHGFVTLSAGQVVTLWQACDTSTTVTWEDLVFSVNELRRL